MASVVSNDRLLLMYLSYMPPHCAVDIMNVKFCGTDVR